jgi:hypothetical protein
MPIVERIKGIILKPKEEWDVIAGETTSTADLLKNYALPLAAIGAVAGFIGSSIIGVSLGPLGTFRVPMVTGLVGGVVGLGIALASVFILGLIVDALAPKFGGEKNSAQALKVAVYSYTPMWVAAVLNVLPVFRALAVLGGLAGAVWGIYVLYLGLPRLMKCPQDKAVVYTVVVVLCGFGISLVAGLIVGAIVGAGAMATGGLPSRM